MNDGAKQIDYIGAYLSDLCAGDDKIGELLAYSVARLLKEAAERGEDWRKQIHLPDLRSIVDFLRIAVCIKPEDDHT